MLDVHHRLKCSDDGLLMVYVGVSLRNALRGILSTKKVLLSEMIMVFLVKKAQVVWLKISPQRSCLETVPKCTICIHRDFHGNHRPGGSLSVHS